MKNLWNKTQATPLSLANFQNAALSKNAMHDLKGGDDIIIHDVVDG